jgi:hypothetical protein
LFSFPTGIFDGSDEYANQPKCLPFLRLAIPVQQLEQAKILHKNIPSFANPSQNCDNQHFHFLMTRENAHQQLKGECIWPSTKFSLPSILSLVRLIPIPITHPFKFKPKMQMRNHHCRKRRQTVHMFSSSLQSKGRGTLGRIYSNSFSPTHFLPLIYIANGGKPLSQSHIPPGNEKREERFSFNLNFAFPLKHTIPLNIQS